MNTNHLPFDYHLPVERIAQRPVVPYDAAKMLVLDRGDGLIRDSSFSELPSFLTAKDLFVFNNTRVIPARLLGRLRGKGGECATEVELLLVEQVSEESWICLGKPLRRLGLGVSIGFAGGLTAQVVERIDDYRIKVVFAVVAGSIAEGLRRAGIMPIPPYIRKGRADEQDREDYQSIFAEADGSVAAPTASLHFTPRLRKAIEEIGCRISLVTLHIGLASFLTIQREDSELIPPGEERFRYSKAVLREVEECRGRGGRVIAVGTTVVRALESMARLDGVADGEFLGTELFITPGFRFLAVDALITNFHQPRSTHLLLVEAFIGREGMVKVYQHALGHDYRFFSYGDGMLVC